MIRMVVSSKDEKLEQVIARVSVVISPENIVSESQRFPITTTLFLEFIQLREKRRRTHLWVYYIHVEGERIHRPFYMGRSEQEAVQFFELYKQEIEAGKYRFEVRK